MDWLFYRSSIAANLSFLASLGEENHLSFHLFAPFAPFVQCTFSLRFSVVDKPFFPLGRVASNASRNTRHERRRRFHFSLPLLFLLPAASSSQTALAPRVSVRASPSEVLPPRCLSDERSSLLRGFGSFVALEPVVGDATTPMQKTQRGRPHLTLRASFELFGIRNCTLLVDVIYYRRNILLISLNRTILSFVHLLACKQLRECNTFVTIRFVQFDWPYHDLTE